MKFVIKNIDEKFVQDCFEKALLGFPPLAEQGITLLQKSVAQTNMRAQPIIDFQIFSRKHRRYKIEISNHPNFAEYLSLNDLPEDVLVGWFAHELGHVMDYLHRSVWGMIKFGLGYWLVPTFRIGAERKADIFAIQQGFAKEVMATKKYILEHSDLPNRYKQKIEKYYLSPEEVALMMTSAAEGLTIDQAI
jgi:hypothetical protein